MIAATGSKSEIVFEALPVDDPQVRQPDITRAQQRARLGAGDRRSTRGCAARWHRWEETARVRIGLAALGAAALAGLALSSRRTAAATN